MGVVLPVRAAGGHLVHCAVLIVVVAPAALHALADDRVLAVLARSQGALAVGIAVLTAVAAVFVEMAARQGRVPRFSRIAGALLVLTLLVVPLGDPAVPGVAAAAAAVGAGGHVLVGLLLLSGATGWPRPDRRGLALTLLLVAALAVLGAGIALRTLTNSWSLVAAPFALVGPLALLTAAVILYRQDERGLRSLGCGAASLAVADLLTGPWSNDAPAGQLLLDLPGTAVVLLGAIELARREQADQRSSMAALRAEVMRREELIRRRAAEAAERDHEIRNGLSGLARVTELVEPGAGPRTGELLSAVSGEIGRLHALLAGSAHGSASFPLAPLLRELAVLHRTAVADVEPELHVAADRAALTQVLTNVLLNARRHGLGAPVWISARARGDAVVIDVEDRGPGLPLDLHETVFERGRSLGGGTGGSGLGLYISRRLVEAEGGRLQLRSGGGPPGATGCLATVELPAPRRGAA